MASPEIERVMTRVRNRVEVPANRVAAIEAAAAAMLQQPGAERALDDIAVATGLREGAAEEALETLISAGLVHRTARGARWFRSNRLAEVARPPSTPAA